MRICARRVPKGREIMVRKLIVAAATGAALLAMLVGVTSSAASASSISLVLPQNNAFAILGYWCGGISEQVFATGFDASSGYPLGDVSMSTTCNGSGRGGHATTHTGWGSATWDYTGAVVSDAKLTSAPTVNPTFSATDSYGNLLHNQSNAAFLSLAGGFIAPPRVTNISASQGPAAGGTSLTITGTGFTNASTVNFGGTPFASIAVNGDTSITLTTPPSTAGTDHVTVTGPGGTSAQSPAFEFTFVATPSVTNLNPNSGPVAGGNQITITGANFTYASAVNFGDQGAGFAVSSDSSITAFVPPSDSGVDQVGVTVASIGGVSASVSYSYTNVAPGSPGAPTIGTATAGDASAAVRFMAPASDGGSTITSYTATASDGTNPANGGQSASGPSTPITVGGLTNGDSYTFTVTATNANSTGPASGPSNAVVPTSSAPGPLAIMTTSLPDATRGVAYSVQLQATGGTTPYKWKKVGALPKGLRLHPDGILSGTPSPKALGAGMYAITVQVTSKRTKASPAQTATTTLTLHVH
jgi:hypothetical protein